MTASTLRRPSLWWIGTALIAVVGLAWAAGAYGGRVTTAPLPTTQFAGETGFSPSDLPGADRIEEAEVFWRAVGTGDLPAVLTALDGEIGTTLTHYAGFAATFEAGFEPEDCQLVAANAVRCTLRATNPALIDLYWSQSETTGYVTSSTVTFSEGGIVSLQLPGVVNSASIRLFVYARAHEGIPPECDRIGHDALDLPPFSTTMAQTAECAAALIPFIPDAIAAEGS